MVDTKVDKLRKDEFVANIAGERNKLRTYRLFKTEPGLEDYTRILCRKNRRLIVELRCGVLPLRIETERWKHKDLRLPAHLRFCQLCDRQAVEDEEHFLLDCPVYNSERDNLGHLLEGDGCAFCVLSDKEKFRTLMQGRSTRIANYIRICLRKRSQLLADLQE